MRYLLIAFLIFTGFFAKAQSPFKPEPKLAPAKLSPDLYAHAPDKGKYKVTRYGITSTDSILNVFRFGVVVSPVGYTFAGVYQASAGVEYGIQHQDYNYATQKYTVLWSANFVYVPISTAAQITSLQQFETVGALFGFDNNLIQLGPFYNPNTPGAFKSKAGAWIVLGINLN